MRNWESGPSPAWKLFDFEPGTVPSSKTPLYFSHSKLISLRRQRHRRPPGQQHLRRHIAGHLNLILHIPTFILPRRPYASNRGCINTIHAPKPFIRIGLNGKSTVLHPNTGRAVDKPGGNGPIGVVVEGIVDRPILLDKVPALRKRGRAVLGEHVPVGIFGLLRFRQIVGGIFLFAQDRGNLGQDMRAVGQVGGGDVGVVAVLGVLVVHPVGGVGLAPFAPVVAGVDEIVGNLPGEVFISLADTLGAGQAEILPLFDGIVEGLQDAGGAVAAVHVPGDDLQGVAPAGSADPPCLRCGRK